MGINFHVGLLREDGLSEAETSIMDILPHIDYVARRNGSDHVVLGSDFDGVIMPRELGNAAVMPKLINHLQGKFYASDALRKATHANWVRWVEQTIKQQNLGSLHQLT